MGRGAQGLSQIVFTDMTALNSLYPGTLGLPQFLKLMPSSSTVRALTGGTLSMPGVQFPLWQNQMNSR